jgi:hypothetical protein
VADSESTRSRRYRLHRSGNHSLCRNCDAQSAPKRDGDGPVAAAHRAELQRMGLAESSEGSVALALAALLDEQKGAMGAAATAARLLALMEDLRKRRPAVRSPLDELRERRAARGA